MEQPGPWRARRSLTELRSRLGTCPPDYRAHEDEHANQMSCLDADKQVKLCSLILVEVFTPATNQALIRSYRRLPFLSGADLRRIERELAATRSTDPGDETVVVCSVRPGIEQTNKAVLRFHDRHLPAGVEAVEITRHSPVPSLTMLVAAFSIDAAAGDLTPLLRRKYRTERRTVEVDVPGALGPMLSRIGWYRPRHYHPFVEDIHSDELRARASARFLADVERRCSQWLSNRFTGYFAAAVADRPAARCFITDLDPLPVDPAAGQALATVGLSGRQPGWHAFYDSTQRWGRTSWRLTDSCPEGRGDVLTVARQVTDFEESPDYSTSWVVGHNFHVEHASLVAHWAVRPTLTAYARTLAQVRDSAWRHRRPVASATHLTRYIAQDGIDIATVSAEITSGQVDSARLGKQYRRPTLTPTHPAAYPSPLPGPDCRSFGEHAWQQTVSTATGLREHYTAVVSVISSFAQLRQSSTNTNLQRAATVIAVLALIVAVVTLMYTG